MADEIEEVEVSSGANEPRLDKPPSGWKVGLTIGGMTLNPFFGIAAGMIQSMRNKSYFEKAAADSTADRNEKNDLKMTIDTEMKTADPDEQRLLKWADMRRTEAYERILGGDREAGNQMLKEVHETIKGIIGGDITTRKQEAAKEQDFKRELVSTAAKGYQQEFRNTTDAFNSANIQAQKIFDLTSQADFDPNKPLNKAHLAELLSTGMAMFKDTPDMMDGLTQGVGAINGMAGGVVGGIATAMKSQDFKVKKEDYIRLALNAQKFTKLFAEQNYTRIGSQANNLNKQAKQWGVFTDDTDLGSYISGGEKELRMSPNASLDTSNDTTNNTPTPTGILLRGGGRGSRPQRPTN